MRQALEGITVIDFSQMYSGPFATQKFADMGADVIKVEPVWGDLARSGELTHKGTSLKFLAKNRNKRSIAIDLKAEGGLEAANALLEDADVMIENFRPGAMDDLGLGYEDVCEYNPGVVYASGSGFGQTGPYADRPGHDLLGQSLSGLPSITGRKDDPPTLAGTPVADAFTGMNLAVYILIALLYRERTGEGQKIEVNLLDSMIEVMHTEVVTVANTDVELERSKEGIAYTTHGPPYGVYETADGYVTITGYPSLEPVVDLVGIDPALFETPEDRFANRDEIKGQIEAYTRERETDDLVETLLEAGCWVSRVNTIEEMVADPQVEHNRSIVELEDQDGDAITCTGVPATLSETPGRLETPAPMLGEHSAEILTEFGYDDEEIESMIDSEVIVVND